MWQQPNTDRLQSAFATFLLTGNAEKVLALLPGGGADASDIHGLKTGLQHPDNAKPAVANTGPNAASTVPATAGYSGMPFLFARLWITRISVVLHCIIHMMLIGAVSLLLSEIVLNVLIAVACRDIS